MKLAYSKNHISILNMTLLGKHTFWSKLDYYLTYPFWYLSTNPRKKSAAEFQYGMIPHKHEFDYDHPFVEQGVKLARCKHFGCYLCDPFEFREKWKIGIKS